MALTLSSECVNDRGQSEDTADSPNGMWGFVQSEEGQDGSSDRLGDGSEAHQSGRNVSKAPRDQPMANELGDKGGQGEKEPGLCRRYDQRDIHYERR